MNFPDQQTLYQIKEGNEAAFSALCAYFHFPAVKFCTVILKDEKEAENITERVFAKIWNERVDIEADRNFQNYLFLNLKNQIFGQMNNCKDPAFRDQYLHKMQSFQESQH